MGMFSWVYSDTDRAMVDGKSHESYLLVPSEFVSEFGSHHIEESCYDGYGIMGGYDVYDLVAYWNKNFIYNNPDFVTKTHNRRLADENWYKLFCRGYYYNSFEDFKRFFEQYGTELRDVGITISCYDNEEIENPIKIVESDNLLYHQAYPSKNDPNQGWIDWEDTIEISKSDLNTLLYVAEYVIDEEFMGDETLAELKEILYKY